jgi:hypothetical protein
MGPWGEDILFLSVLPCVSIRPLVSSLPPTCPRTRPTDGKTRPHGPGHNMQFLAFQSGEGGIRTPGALKEHNGFRGLSPRSGAGCLVCISTVLCGGNTAFVVPCPLSTGEFATRMPPRVWVVAAWAG